MFSVIFFLYLLVLLFSSTLVRTVQPVKKKFCRGIGVPGPGESSSLKTVIGNADKDHGFGEEENRCEEKKRCGTVIRLGGSNELVYLHGSRLSALSCFQVLFGENHCDSCLSSGLESNGDNIISTMFYQKQNKWNKNRKMRINQNVGELTTGTLSLMYWLFSTLSATKIAAKFGWDRAVVRAADDDIAWVFKGRGAKHGSAGKGRPSINDIIRVIKVGNTRKFKKQKAMMRYLEPERKLLFAFLVAHGKLRSHTCIRRMFNQRVAQCLRSDGLLMVFIRAAGIAQGYTRCQSKKRERTLEGAFFSELFKEFYANMNEGMATEKPSNPILSSEELKKIDHLVNRSHPCEEPSYILFSSKRLKAMFATKDASQQSEAKAQLNKIVERCLRAAFLGLLVGVVLNCLQIACDDGGINLKEDWANKVIWGIDKELLYKLYRRYKDMLESHHESPVTTQEQK